MRGGLVRSWTAVVVAVWVVTLGGPGRVAAASATPVATPEAQTAGLLATAAATMQAVTSYHFTLTYEEGTTTIYRRIKMEKAEGAVLRPDRFKATIEAKLGPLSVDVEVVSVGGRLWVTTAGVGEELDIDEAVARVLLDPTAILTGAAGAIREPVVVGEGQLDGVAVTRIAGTVEASALEAGADNPVLANEAPMPVELAIDAQGHIVSLRLDGPLVAADSDDVVRRLDLSEFDQPVEIEPPAGA